MRNALLLVLPGSLLLGSLFLGGCDARYEPGSDVDRGGARDGAPFVLDGAASDLAGVPDLLGDQTVASGTFGGRQGHAGAGHAMLVTDASGHERVVLGDDFVVTDVPGPVVLLTARTSIGTSIASEDAQLGILASATGAGTYAVPGGSQGRRNVFVYCKPFGTEVALAPLSP